MTTSIDEIDRQIIALMQADGRATSKFIAAEIGVSESTVANRLKRLIEAKVIRVTIEEDVRFKGYDLYVFANIRTEPGHRDAVARAIAKNDAISIVLTTVAASEVILLFFAKDHANLNAILDEAVAPVKGVRSISI